MTIKEISDLTNVSRSTVLRKIKELFPTIIENGKTVKLTKDQSISIVDGIKKTGFIQPIQNEKVPIQNEKVDKIELMFIEFMKQQTETNKILLSLVQNNNQPKQIEEKKQSQMTIKEYLESRNIEPYNLSSFKIQVGKKVTQMSKEYKRTISYKQEGLYSVGAFDLDIISHCVEMVTIENDRKQTLFN